jgi:hypothetical protein
MTSMKRLQHTNWYTRTEITTSAQIGFCPVLDNSDKGTGLQGLKSLKDMV